MANKISLTSENTKYLIDAFTHFFPEDTIYAADKPYVSGEFNWKNRADFIDFINRLTGVLIKSERDLENIKKAQLAVEALTSNIKEEKPVDSNLPDKEARELLELERQKREAELNEAKEKGEKSVQEAIKRKQEVYNKEQAVKKEQTQKDVQIETPPQSPEAPLRENQDKKTREFLTNEKIIVTPTQKLPEVLLTNDEKVKIFNLAQAIKKDPGTAQKIFELKIQESVGKSSEDVKQNISGSQITKTSIDLIEKIKPFGVYSKPEDIPSKIVVMNPASPLVALANPNNERLVKLIPDTEIRKELSQNAAALSLALDSNMNLDSALTAPLFDNSENMSELFYPQQLSEFQIGEKQDIQEGRDEGVEINLEDVYDQGKDVWDTWQKIANRTVTTEEVTTSTLSTTPSYLPSTTISIANESTEILATTLPTTVGAITGIKTSSLVINLAILRTRALPNPALAGLLTTGGTTQIVQTAAPLISRQAFMITSSSGKLAFFAGKGLTVGGSKVFAIGIKLGQSSLAASVGSGGTKVVASGLFAKIGATLGSLGTPVVAAIGAAVGWVVGKIIQKIPWDKVKKYASFAIGVVLGIGAYAIAGPIAGISVGFGSYGLASVATGGAAGLKGAGANIGNFFTALGGIVFSSIGMPVLITILVFPVIVALILFVINSGAYIVPPTSEVFGGISSPYIEITKTPDPPGPFTNNELPKTVNYNITIKAKKGVLTNVGIKYDCQVTSSSSKNCPSISNIPSSVDSISPSLPYTFSYTSTYDKGYNDSSIIDTITVTADVAEKSGVTSETSASITFGAPPISCPLPAGKPVNSMNYSYNSQTDSGHGSTTYWNAMGGTPYRYSIPQWTGCRTPDSCPYYGYAYDVFPNGVKTVYAPTVLGKETTWNLSATFSNGAAGYTVMYADTTGAYVVVLTHVAGTNAPKTVTSGTKVATLFNQGTNTHLHLEFQVNGHWVKPENYFCK